MTQFPISITDGDYTLAGTLTLTVGQTPPPDPDPVPEPTTLPVLRRGVNLAGAEFGSKTLPGIRGQTYIYASNAIIDYFASIGCEFIRLPFRWERLQRTLGGDLDAGELAEMDRVIARCASHSMRVGIDMHNYGRWRMMAADGVAYTDYIIEETDPAIVSKAHYADFWGRLAAHCLDKPNVDFDLMNEPNAQDYDILATVYQAAIDAIRATGSTAAIHVSGGFYAKAETWATTALPWIATLIDPLNNLIWHAHQYLDDGSGQTSTIEKDGATILQEFTDACRAHGMKGFIGEFGIANTTESLAEHTEFFQHMKANRDVYAGWSAWSGGSWWPSSYPFKLGSDNPQTMLLASFIDDPNENLEPSDLSFTPSPLSIDAPVGAVVGQVVVHDPNEGDTHTLTIDDPSGQFGVSGMSVVVAGPLVSGNHPITLTVTDEGGLFRTETFHVPVGGFIDLFDRPDEDLEVSYTRIGGAAGTGQVQNGALAAVGTVGTNYVRDSGTPDHYVSAVSKAAPSSNALVIKAIDESNYLLFRASNGAWRIVEVRNGAFYQPTGTSLSALPDLVGQVRRAEAIGNEIRCYVDGQLVVSATVDPKFAANTMAGVRLQTAASPAMDNLKAGPL